MNYQGRRSDDTSSRTSRGSAFADDEDGMAHHFKNHHASWSKAVLGGPCREERTIIQNHGSNSKNQEETYFECSSEQPDIFHEGTKRKEEITSPSDACCMNLTQTPDGSCSPSANNDEDPSSSLSSLQPPPLSSSHGNPINQKASPSRYSRHGGALALFLSILLAVFFTGSVPVMVLERLVRVYLIPQMRQMHRVRLEQTYPPRHCKQQDAVTAHSPEELLIPENSTARQHFSKHGAVLFENILSPETAAALRTFILKENERNDDTVSVFNARHRRSFQIQIDHHPSVAKAAKEILSHRHVVNAIEDIVGVNPAVTEFTSITAFYGAKIQPFHSDSSWAANFHARSYWPAYSLFVALQNTTASMGTTEVCPGTHVCEDDHANEPSHCDQAGVGVSLADLKQQQPIERSNNSTTRKYWPVGTAALISQQTHHRGAAHTLKTPVFETDDDENNATARVMFYFTFAPRPRFGKTQVETRSFPINGTFGQHWAQWGFTLRDYQNPERYMKWPWRIFRSLGLYKPAGRQWGWDYISLASFGIEQRYCNYIDWDLEGDADDENIDEYFYDMDKSDVGGIVEGFHAMYFFKYVMKPIKCLFVYLYVGVMIWYVLLERRRRRRLPANSRPAITTRLLLLHHALVLFLLWAWQHQISKTSWARNIHAGRLYRTSTNANDFGPETHHLDEIQPITVDDVLVLDHVRSDYLGSLSVELDYAHPGNQVFRAMVTEFSTNFDRLPSLMQRGVCFTMLERLREVDRRVMATAKSNVWTELDEEDAMRFCHKEMMITSNAFVGEAIMQLDYLLSESRYGYWRDTAMHKDVIPSYLRSFQDRIMRFKSVKTLKLGNGYTARSKGTLTELKVQPTCNKRCTIRKNQSVNVNNCYCNGNGCREQCLLPRRTCLDKAGCRRRRKENVDDYFRTWCKKSQSPIPAPTQDQCESIFNNDLSPCVTENGEDPIACITCISATTGYSATDCPEKKDVCDSMAGDCASVCSANCGTLQEKVALCVLVDRGCPGVDPDFAC